MKLEISFTVILIYVIQTNALNPKVTFSKGTVSGIVMKSRNNRDIWAFLGIPYAEAPIGDLRFKNPRPKKSWKDVYVANKTTMCAQVNGGKVYGEEDCLHLNVYVPQLKSKTKKLLPVMAYIHGGGFITGGSDPSSYGPGYLLDKDIIMVSMNYRLSCLGFLSTGDHVSPGNYGLKDQTLALKWIKRNIRAFGGDPKKVTICGLSAGSGSVHFHTLSKLSKGLFHRSIMQSGTALGPWAFNNRTSYPEKAQRLAKLYNCPIDDSEKMIDCLRKLPVEKLMSQSTSMFTVVEALTLKTWGPTNEPPSKNSFITDFPANILGKKKRKVLPSLTGVCRQEGLLISYPLKFLPDLYNLLAEKFQEFLELNLQPYILPRNNFKLTKRVMDFYFNGTLNKDRNVVLEQLRDYVTDSWFVYPAIRTLEYEKKVTTKPRVDHWLYRFDYHGSFIWPVNDTKLGPTHGEDSIYMFPRSYPTPMNANDTKMIDTMVDLITSFVINGKPKPDTWTPYNNYLRIGRYDDPGVTLKHHMYEERMNFWMKNARRLEEEKQKTTSIRSN